MYAFTDGSALLKPKMPRKKGDARAYSETALVGAVASVKNKTLSYKKASEKFNVPVATICDRIKQRVPIEFTKPGRLCEFF